MLLTEDSICQKFHPVLNKEQDQAIAPDETGQLPSEGGHKQSMYGDKRGCQLCAHHCEKIPDATRGPPGASPSVVPLLIQLFGLQLVARFVSFLRS